MLLEAGQRQVVVRLGVLFDLVTVEFPKHPQEYLPRRTGSERFLEDFRELVGFGIRPQVVEPADGTLDDGPVVASEAEFQVGGQAGDGEVGGTGDGAAAPFVGVAEDVRLGVQEGALVAADFDVPGVQRGAELLQSGAGRTG